MRKLHYPLSTLLLFFLFASSAQATDWYADVSRPDDTATCTQAQTKATAKKTIAAALACVGSGAGAGANDRVIVVAGTYPDRLIGGNTFPSGTSFAAPFTLMAENSTQNDTVKGTTGDLVLFNVNNTDSAFDMFSAGAPTSTLYSIIQGFTFDGTASTGGAAARINIDRVRFTNNEIKNWTGGNATDMHGSNLEVLNNYWHDGIYLYAGQPTGGQYSYGIYTGGANNTFSRNKFVNLSSWAIHLFKAEGCLGGATINDNTMDNVGMTDLRGAAIMLCGDNNIAYNNIVSDSFTALSTFRAHTGNRFYNNTVYNNVQGADLQSSNTNLELKNNVFVNNGTNIIRVSNPDQFVVSPSGNLANYCTTSGGDALCSVKQSAVGAPGLVDPANSDFRPCTASGAPHANCTGVSPLIDAGTDLSAIFTTSIDGTPRPVNTAYDIGAYEAGATSDPSPLIVVKLSFDDVATDQSGQANHGTIGGGAGYVAGKYNSALSFDGINDQVTIADATSLDLTHGFTLAAWVKPSSVATDAAIVVKNPSRYFLFASIDGYCGTNAVMAGFSTATQTLYACYTTPLTAGVYTHVAATYDRTNIKIYINKTLVTQAAASAFIPVNAETVQIGGSVFNEWFTGEIDEVYVKNAALTQTEINTLADTPFNSLTPSVPSILFGSSANGLKLGASASALKLP